MADLRFKWVKTLSGPDYTETSVNTVKHFVKETSADLPSPEQFYQAFEAKFNTGPSYQFASAMAGLYHLGELEARLYFPCLILYLLLSHMLTIAHTEWEHCLLNLLVHLLLLCLFFFLLFHSHQRGLSRSQALIRTLPYSLP